MGKAIIDLAPGHKVGLVVSSPVLLAGGIIGLGEAVPVGVEIGQLGAVVVGPLRRHPSAGTAPPRLAEAAGQIVLETGLQNRGLNATLKRYARYWARLGAPVIVQLADTEIEFLGYVAARLAEQEAVVGLELLVPADLGRALGDGQSARLGEWLAQALRTLDQQSDLPLWVKLPLAQAAQLAPLAIDAGAVGLVIGQSPVGTLTRTGEPLHLGAPASLESSTPALIRGPLFGPALLPLMLHALLGVAKLELPAALIACGGIHTVTQATQVLAMGADALQLDSAVWIEPGIANLISGAL